MYSLRKAYRTPRRARHAPRLLPCAPRPMSDAGASPIAVSAAGQDGPTTHLAEPRHAAATRQNQE